uniref:Uncharacterized protein n=1 Tax=Caenorhabditis japonica TaxID=281687 RepID=A0A8R1EIU3_CAEJA
MLSQCSDPCVGWSSGVFLAMLVQQLISKDSNNQNTYSQPLPSLESSDITVDREFGELKSKLRPITS